eukprot:3195904-Ditylum_brightwellii.AAC.1
MNCDLLKQYGFVSLEAMKRHAQCYFGDGATTDNVPALDAMDIADITPSTDDANKRIFYKRVLSNMIATVIKNNLTLESWCCLMLKKEEFTWTKSDGTEVFDRPTLIWVILATLKPTRNVGVQSEICAIASASLSGYGNDPLKMLDGMDLKFNLIKDISGKSVFTTKQFTIKVLNATLKEKRTLLMKEMTSMSTASSNQSKCITSTTKI